MYDFDLVVIGAGSAGTRAARFASSNHGVKAAIVEMPFGFVSSDSVGGAGGTCVIRGCVPKKLMVYASHFSEDFEDAVHYGWEDSQEKHKHDWNTLVAKKSAEVARLNGIYMKLLKGAGVTIFEGRGRLIDAHSIHVSLAAGGEKTITAENIILSTGSKAFKPDIPGKELCITSDEALHLDSVNEETVFAVIGGGYIAVEFSGIFSGLGATVHLLYRKPLPLRGFDEECRQRVADNLSLRGINVHSDCSPVEVEKLDDGRLSLKYVDKNGVTAEVIADYVMMATGRKPYFKDLGLEDVGVEVDKGVVKVNDISQTSVPHIYALGDLTDRMNLTPVALMEAMAVIKTLYTNERTSPDYTHVPSAVFCQPPLATVGYTEQEAIDKFNGMLDIYTSSFRTLKSTLTGRQEKTFVKVIVHAESDKVVGVHMVGTDSAEIMQGIAIAIKAGATKTHFDTTVGIHPSSAEEFVTLRTKTRSVEGNGMESP